MTAPTLGELIEQHHALELALAEALAHPASSDAEIAAIKRKKLKLKDEIAMHERGRSLAA
jgi:hypothetical protein